MPQDKNHFVLPELSTRQLVAMTLVVGLVGIGFSLIFRFHQALLILLAGIVVSLALKPVVTRLQQRGIPAWVTLLLTYTLVAVLAFVLLRFGLPVITHQLGTISAEVNAGYAELRDGLMSGSNLIVRRLAEALPEELGAPGSGGFGVVPVVPAPPVEDAFRQGLTLAGSAFIALLQVAAIFIIAFFWTLESERIKLSALLLVPVAKRESARELIQAMEQRVSAYVSGQLLLSGIIGGLALIAYVIIGVPNALALGLFAALMEVIPVIGPLIAAIPAIFLALTVSPVTALWVVIALVIIHQLESNVIGPRIMRRAIDMRPLVTLIALTAFGSLFGILGALVALPLASILQLLLDRYVLDTSLPTSTLSDRGPIGVIRYDLQTLIEDVRKLIRRQEEAPLESGEQLEDTVEAIAVDLDSLLAQISRDEEPRL